MQNSSILMKYAINYLSKYSSSKTNLERMLNNKIRRMKVEKQDKYILYNSIKEIIDKLEKNKFINDHNYTLSKISFFSSQGKSKNFIKNYFMQKGIDKNIIDETFEKFESDDPNWEIKSAKKFVKKKRLLNNIENKEKGLSKLGRAGFSYEISKKILEEN